MALGDQLTTLAEGLSGLTEAEKFNFANAIIMENYAGVNIEENRTALSQIRNGNKLPIFLNEDDFEGFPTVGGCELSECDWDDPVSDYVWQIGEIGCKLKICMKTLSDSFLAFWNIHRNMGEEDMNSVFIKYIVEKFQRRLRNAQFRTLYYGDSDSSNDLINAFDGLIKQYEAGGGAKVEITENEGEDPELIKDGLDVYNYMKELYNELAGKPWFNPSEMKWEMNRELVNRLVGFLNTQSDLKEFSCDCIDPTKVSGARLFDSDNLAIFGIPVYPLPFTQAQNAISDYDGGLNVIILNRKQNDLLGYETENALNNFDIGYNREDRYIYLNGSSLFGGGIPTDAYGIAI